MSIRKHIVAFGGGGLTVEQGLLLEKYLLSLTAAAHPKVCFVPTASGDDPNYIEAFHTAFTALGCVTSHLTLNPCNVPDIADHLLSQDIIYVGGGNTINMLKIWRELGVDVIMRKAWESGIVLSGVSAGSNCWFEGAVTDSLGPLTHMECLGFLAGSNCPHYDSQPERRPSFQRFISEGLLPSGVAADDWAGYHFIDDTLHKVVSAKPNARAFRVEKTEDGFTETELIAELLKSDE